MRNALFIAFLLVALAYALRRGGGPERAMAGIAAALVISDQLLHLLVPPQFEGLDTGHLAIDLAGAGASVLLAMIAHRFWPMIAAVLHIFPLLAHLSKALDVPMHPVTSSKAARRDYVTGSAPALPCAARRIAAALPPISPVTARAAR